MNCGCLPEPGGARVAECDVQGAGRALRGGGVNGEQAECERECCDGARADAADACQVAVRPRRAALDGWFLTGCHDGLVLSPSDLRRGTRTPVLPRRECRLRARAGLALGNEPACGSGPRLLPKEELVRGAVPGFLPSAEVGGLGRIVASLT